MDVTSATSGTASTAEKSGAGLAKDFNTFLTLLTTQLQNQDPLSPMDSTQFTQQLVSFTGVEQQINANKNLETLIAKMSAQDMSNAVSYLGREVTVNSNQGKLQDGEASWDYNLDTTASKVQLTVRNSSGATVYTGTGATQAGNHTFNWDGSGPNGGHMADGTYTLEVSALSAAGNSINTAVYQKGIVDSVDTSGGQNLLSVNGVKISRDAIVAVSRPPARSDP